jgi:cytochrome b561
MASPVRTSDRYGAVAVLLHWLIALLVLAIATLGLVMTHVKLTPLWQFRFYQWHKSIGITILILATLRLLWRLAHRPPPLPDAMPRLEKRAAAGTHLLLYGLMLGLPIVGWALVSASPLNLPTVLYGLVRWPDLPVPKVLPGIGSTEKLLGLVHAYGAYVLIGLVVLHALAALRHHVVLKDDVVRRMLPTPARKF